MGERVLCLSITAMITQRSKREDHGGKDKTNRNSRCTGET